jgi:ribosomal protein S12 methylthiotransferase accessory factor
VIAQATVPARNIDALATHLTSAATGIVRRLGLYPSRDSYTRFYSAYAELADARILGCCGEIQTPGGAGFTVEEAVTRALFEAVERYCGAFFDPSNGIWGKALDERFLCGESFPLYTEEQYRQPGWPFVPFTEASRVWWTPATCLHSGETRYVPSALVYIPYKPGQREECIGPSLSTGMAAGWNWEEACLSGLYETCERDAFALMWAARRAGPRLLPTPGSLLEAEVERSLGSSGATVTFVDITNDLQVPTAVAVLRHRHANRPIVAVGSAAKPNLECACRKALAEAVSVQQALALHLDGADADWSPNSDFSNVTDWKWHPLVYTRLEFEKELSFITSSAESKPVGEESASRETLRSLVNRLKKHFREIVAVDLTTPDLAEIPVRAVKIMAPHAVPLEPDHRYRRQAVPRLRACGNSINPFPHPFL